VLLSRHTHTVRHLAVREVRFLYRERNRTRWCGHYRNLKKLSGAACCRDDQDVCTVVATVCEYSSVCTIMCVQFHSVYGSVCKVLCVQYHSVYSSVCTVVAKVCVCVRFCVYSSVCTVSQCVRFCAYSSVCTVLCVQFSVYSSVCTVSQCVQVCVTVSQCVQFHSVYSSVCKVSQCVRFWPQRTHKEFLQRAKCLTMKQCCIFPFWIP